MNSWPDAGRTLPSSAVPERKQPRYLLTIQITKKFGLEYVSLFLSPLQLYDAMAARYAKLESSILNKT